MRHAVVAAVAFVLCLSAIGTAFAWEPPEDCDDDQREVPGNRSTPCKIPGPVEVGEATYRVKMYYPECREEITIAVAGLVLGDKDSAQPYVDLANLQLDDYNYLSTNDHRYQLFVIDEALVWAGNVWELTSSIEKSRWARREVGSQMRVRLRIQGASETYSLYSKRLLSFPDYTGFRELANACLELVAQEKADREHAAQLARDEAAAAAKVQAESDAARKEEEQAQREAEAQARIAQAKLKAALESKARVARAELLKTQTLEAKLEHEATIAEILRDIVRIRLAGEQDRAYITNEYLAALAIVTEVFEAETAEAEARIQQYVDFNAVLLERIDGYWATVDARLQRVSDSVNEQLDQIAEIEAEAAQIAIPEQPEGDTE